MNVTQLSQRERYVKNITSGRINIILLVMLTVINVIFLFTESQRYFLASAFIPYRIAFHGAFWSGNMPKDHYADMGDIFFLSNGFLVAMLVISAIILALYVLCFFFSKNRVSWIICATVIFSLDTLIFIAYSAYYGIFVDNILDMIMHAYILYGLISATVSFYKLKKLPDEVPISEDIANTDGVISESIESNDSSNE